MTAKILTALALVAAAACGPGRTTAATQPTPAAFDPTKSDPKALEVVDASLAALGGRETWDAAKQLTFTVRYFLDGQLKGWYVHHWDRWNGRHNYRSADLPKATGGPETAPWIEVYYDLFDRDAKPNGTYDGREVDRDAASNFRKEARSRLADDGYWLTMYYKVRDPGVILGIDAPDVPAMDGACEGGCVAVKVTFDPAVGKDTWFILYNKGSNMPELIQKQTGTGRLGFKIAGWQDAGGLKFPTKLQNLGVAGEIFEFSEIAIGEPDDRLYVPQVTGAGGE